MQQSTRWTKLLTPALFASALFSASAFSAWQLENDKSQLNFISVKKNVLAETHHFKQLTGKISDDGHFMVVIDLTSVETNIPIRNDRMQAMLFKTDQYTSAKVSGKVEQANLDKLSVGEYKDFNVSATLSLHGEEQVLPVALRVFKTANKDLIVSTVTPSIVYASQFKLAEGIEKLRKIAGLPSIVGSVPVTFSLVFSEKK